MGHYRDAAVVLRTYKLGEADRIVVLLTRRGGKVRAVAKGVRRTRSKFGSRLEPGSYIDVQLYEGRGELDIVNQAETLEHFRRTREDLTRLSRSAALLEAVDQLALEREPSPRLFDMLVGGVRTIEQDNPPLVVGAFFLKLLAAEGVEPELGACIECNSVDGPFVWAVDAGGLRCRACGSGRAVSDEALTVSRAVLGGGLKSALDLPDSSLVHEVEDLAARSLEAHIERKLRSLHLIAEA
ncbi:MAG: DNA repair protein RecO [Microthrixaceae bacterium]|nr:DNA repair protein RecO [Microthrixaceae bacterium]